VSTVYSVFWLAIFMSSKSTYQYQPLARGEIRLLQLLPGDAHVENDIIRLNIIHTSLGRCNVPESLLSYEALSYVWGGERTVPVYCGTHQILATPNLVSALSRLRTAVHGDVRGHRTLWVDAICINQDDVEERGHQVRLIREIYSQASRVLIWLGDSEDVKYALGQVKEALPHKPNLHELDYKRNLHELDYMQNLHERDYSRLDKDFFAFLALSPILDLPWFQRVWVIQEVVFSSKAILLAGDTSTEWERLIDVIDASICWWPYRLKWDAVLAIEGLRKRIQEGGLAGSKSGPTTTHVASSILNSELKSYAVAQVLLLRSLLHQGQDPTVPWALRRSPTELLGLAELFRSCSASDPRDKLYALLGLVAALDADRPASSIEADYSLSVDNVFMSLARHLLYTPDPLTFLRNAYSTGRKAPENALPSWVPDWSTPTKIRPLSNFCRKLPSQRRTRRAVIFKDANPCALKILGKKIDTIKAVGEAYTAEVRKQPDDKMCTSWHQFFSKHGASNWQDIWDELRPVVRTSRGQSISNMNIDTRSPIDENFNMICLGRRMVITETGHSGLAPADAQNCDEVAMFPGAQLPFVVRQNGQKGNYHLVGECCLSGINLDTIWRSRKYKNSEFCLV
jgi:hypothetical protein